MPSNPIGTPFETFFALGIRGPDMQEGTDDDLYRQRPGFVISEPEALRPLIGFDATLKNGLLAKIEHNRDRNLSMSLTNYQVTEARGKEYVFGTGYRFKNVKLPFRLGGAKPPPSDLNIRVDFSLRENFTVIRLMEQEQNQITAGQKVFSIKASTDYVLNQRLNVRLFYERVVNTPLITTSFPRVHQRSRTSSPARPPAQAGCPLSWASSGSSRPRTSRRSWRASTKTPRLRPQ